MEGNSRQILVIDDSKPIRDVLSKMLSFIGYEVVVASSGSEGLDLFSKNSIGLVLTDLHMPDIDGWTLAFHIKDKSPTTPVVLITGSEEESIMEKLSGSCVDSVMFKPVRLQKIEKTVQRLLDDTRCSEGSALASFNRPSVS